MSDATDFVRVLQKRIGNIIASPETTAYSEDFTTLELAAPLIK
jgi:hypothetical protein